MYHKYNTVLRSKSGNQFLMQQFEQLCKGNTYRTTIHAVNSCVIKLSKLTSACKVWRGFTDARLPDTFWSRNEQGVRGGVEYGFSSTTTEREQAIAYADGNASTLFEMQMGLVDRGAELSWLSQYPHEREILFPPLTGIEMVSSDVDGQSLVIQVRPMALQ